MSSTPLFECLSYNCTRILWAGIKQKLRAKVDVVEGKGLSSNDFTTELKNKLNNIPANAISENDAVTGVKGNAEESYRTGPVNITPANIGLGNVSNLTDANRSVGSAACLTTARLINGILFNGTSNVSNFGKCSTAAATQEKVVTIGDIYVAENTQILVEFENTNTIASPTLNVNNSGAFEIRYKGTALDGDDYNIESNGIYEFVLSIDTSNNTAYWNIVGGMNGVSAGTSSQAYTVSYDATNEAIVITNNTAGAVSVSNEIIVFS